MHQRERSTTVGRWAWCCDDNIVTCGDAVLLRCWAGALEVELIYREFEEVLAAMPRLDAFVDASPTPYHMCVEAADALRAAGFEELTTESAPDSSTGGRYQRRTVRLLPEDGCNIEDLAAVITRAELPAAAAFCCVFVF